MFILRSQAGSAALQLYLGDIFLTSPSQPVAEILKCSLGNLSVQELNLLPEGTLPSAPRSSLSCEVSPALVIASTDRDLTAFLCAAPFERTFKSYLQLPGNTYRSMRWVGSCAFRVGYQVFLTSTPMCEPYPTVAHVFFCQKIEVGTALMRSEC